MKLIITLSAFVTFSAFANITCKGAMSYAVEDVVSVQKALATQALSFEEAALALDLENGRHRDVILACKTRGPQEKITYCGTVPKLLIQRDALIKKQELLTKKEKHKLIRLNKFNRELAFINCP